MNLWYHTGKPPHRRDAASHAQAWTQKGEAVRRDSGYDKGPRQVTLPGPLEATRQTQPLIESSHMLHVQLYHNECGVATTATTT